MSQVRFQLVTEKEIDQVIEGTYKVMEEVGQAIYQPDAVKLLKDAGCIVDGERVKIPRELVEKPFMIMYVEPASPLLHTKEPVEVLMECAKLGIPCVYTPGSLIGATVPAILPGAMTVSMAESLTGLVIAQLVNPGAPMICAGHGGVVNLKTMNHCYGMIESPMYNGLGAECMHRLGLPAWHLAGATDSKVIDAQAITDAVFQTIIALGTGGNLEHDVGFADLALTGSIEYMVMCDEVIGMAKRLFKGIDFEDAEDAFAFDVIKEVGPQGNFLLEDHTLDHCYDFYSTSIMDYNNRAK